VPGLASGTTQGALPWSWYSDPELLRREQERIFQRGWQYAGPAEHAGERGDYFTCSIGDVPVVVTRDRAGELHALLNVCRHRGSIVAEGRGNRETLQCRYHAWTCQFGPTKRGEGQVEGRFHWLWPVTKLYALPVPPNLAAGPVVPLGPERTRGFLDYFFPEDVPETTVEELFAFDDQVGLEDRALVESVQAGVRSGLLDEGKRLPESERLIAHFQQLVREALA
jgi:phenylpropionate dioxygenase-like ring-hydroxylating dioxygenase large terminal subunit